MKKFPIYFWIPLLLVSCGGTETSSSSAAASSLPSSVSSEFSSLTTSEASSSEVSSETVISTTLKQMMEAYRMLGNYTYTITDEIFNVTTTLRYTKTAFYYEPDTSSHGGEAYGYAENETGVFMFRIQEDTVEMNPYLTDSYGDYVHNLWFTTILSFLDIVVEDLPDEPESGNLYHITDANNKLLISGLAGFGDAVLQSYIDVYIELTSDVTFRTIVHTSGLPGGYNGYAYGELSAIGTTSIPEIEAILAEGGGPEDLDTALLDMMKQLQSAKNYTITLSGAINAKDEYTIRNCYSTDLDDASLSKGYAGSSDGVFRYTIADGEVQPGELVSNGSGGVFSSIWGMTGIYNFYEMSLANFTYEATGTDTYRITSYATVSLFAQVAHVDAVAAYSSSNTLEVSLTEDGMEFDLEVEGTGSIHGVVDQIGTTSLPLIEEYIQNGGGPVVYGDMDDTCRQTIALLSRAKNYTLNIESTFTTNAFSMQKKYTPTAYYQEYQDHQNDFGYVEKDAGIFKFTLEDGIYEEAEQVQEEGAFLWASGLFKGFQDLDTSSMTGKRTGASTYTITDSDTRNTLYQIAGFGIYDLMFYLKELTVTLLDTSTGAVRFDMNLGSYGAVSMEVTNIGTTVIL